jgi:hypothetical protein
MRKWSPEDCISKGQTQFIVSFWRQSDGVFRWPLIGVLAYTVGAIGEFFLNGPNDVRWIKDLCMAVAFWAILPFYEPPLKSLPWHRQLRKPRGLLFLFALAFFFILDRYRHN